MDRIEFLVEEPSIAAVLKKLLPQILPAPWTLDENYFIREHNGKSDLRRSIPNKLNGFGRIPNQVTGFVIVQDQDSNDCRILKQELIQICEKNTSVNIRYLVRIVCRELESWYIGDVNALHAVFPRFDVNNARLAKFRDPDRCVNPKNELKKIIGEYSQIATAKEMGQHMDIAINKSISFNQFITGVKHFIQQ